MFPAHTYDKRFAVFTPHLVHNFHKFGVVVQPIVPTIFAVPVPRLIDDIHLVAAVS